jgi:predicted phosphodiesterase
MKALVISDIHSNIYALNAICAKEKKYDILCCAGDFVDYGTEPAKVVYWAEKQENSYLVQGNHDLHIVNTYHEVDYGHLPAQEFKWVHHNCRMLSPDDICFLEHLPLHLAFEMDGYAYLIQHQYDSGYGVIESSWQFDRYWERYAPKYLWNHPKRRMIFGHSHRQCIHILGDETLWINPGSASYRRPDDPDKTAHYAVIEDGRIELRRIAYDRKPLLQVAQSYARANAMMMTELQDAFFFFGSAKTSREPLKNYQEE